MRAIVRGRFGGPDSLVIKEVPEPEPKPGYVVIQIKAKPSRVFRFEDIREAHRVMEANEAKGKLVVRL